jgi:EF hand
MQRSNVMKPTVLWPVILTGLLATAAYADFSDVDTDGDGRLTQDELEAKLAADFADGDANSDGYISAEEFLNWIGIEVTDETLDQATAMLNAIADDDDGHVQLADVEERIASVDSGFDRIDADGDGTVSQDERDSAKAEAKADAEDARDQAEQGLKDALDRIKP